MTCLMISEVMRFSSWEAFDRALERIRNDLRKYYVRGVFYLPIYRAFAGGDEFRKAVGEVQRVRYTDHCCIFGEIVVEIT